MNKNHYYEKVHMLIYALITDGHYVYIGKTISSTLASIHSRHIHGNCAATRNAFGMEPQTRPEVYLLKAGTMTQAIGYKYLLAYIRYFAECGYAVLNHKASLLQAQDLQEDTMALYREISELPLAQQLQEGIIKKPSMRLAPTKPTEVVSAPKPKKERAEERLCLRLTSCEKQEFSEYANRLHLSQRDAVLYMLKGQNSQLAGSKGWVIDRAVNYTTRKQSQKIQKLEKEIEILKQKLNQEESDMSQRIKDRMDIWKQGITTMLSKAAAYAPTHDSRQYDFAFSEGKATQFCLMFLVPIMTALKISDYRRYEAFVTGKDSSPLRDLLGNTEMGSSLRRSLLANNETYDEAEKTERIKIVNFEERLEELYDALFIKQYSSRAYEVRLGQMSFGSESRTTLLRAVSALSQYADFDA